MRASATAYISSSVPLCLKAFRQNSMNRQLPWTYPSAGTMRSRLGAKIFVPMPRMMRNGIPDNSHFPVHLDDPHSSVRSNGIPASLARLRAPPSITDHGLFTRCICFLTILRWLASSLWLACHSLLAVAARTLLEGRALHLASDSRALSGNCSTYRRLYSRIFSRYAASAAYFSRLFAKSRFFSLHRTVQNVLFPYFGKVAPQPGQVASRNGGSRLFVIRNRTSSPYRLVGL